MKLNPNPAQTPNEESVDRRQFLRNALRIGGAAAFVLSTASRLTLAESLALDARQMDAARRARQLPAAGRTEDSAPELEARADRPNGCVGCEGGCSGACTGGCTSCSGCSGCTASCSSGCSSGCSGGCRGGCEGHCSGCSGVNL